MEEWIRSDSKSLRFAFYNGMELCVSVCCVTRRYFVYRRCALSPLFHPYYLNYGGNKQDIYFRFRALQCRSKRA